MTPTSTLLLLVLAVIPAVGPGPGPTTKTVGSSTTPSQARDPMIRFHVGLPQRQAHRVQVRMTVDGLIGDEFEISMPVWTPGSYLVREFARNVLDLEARDPEGEPLPVSKTNKNTWRIASGGRETVTVEYTLYANELSVRTNHVDDAHAFLSPAATFFYVRERQHEPYQVTVDTPEDWYVYTGLPTGGGGWVAEDYDTLVDSPLEIGPHRVLSFTVRDVPHRVIVSGHGKIDAPQLTEDTQKICEEVASIFDQMPFDDYTFILLLVDAGGGGLEHKNSSVNMMSRWALSDTKRYRGLLSLLAHEYFHAWNVKRFRPASLGPFDYDVENYTTDLWVAEGLTSYYDDLVPVRAGFADKVEDYLSDVAAAFRAIHDRPGAMRTSLASSSWDTWIKQYRPDENSVNSTVSYYSKGALVGLMLDLRIRRATAGESSLAHALRLGWERYTSRGVGYPDGELQQLAADVADGSLNDFFADYVDGTRALDPNPELAWVGLELKVSPEETKRELPADEDGYKLEVDLGLSTRDKDGLCRVSSVVEGGAAFHAGLNVDDLILAVDGMRVTASNLDERIDVVGSEQFTITYFRGESLRQVELTASRKRLEAWRLAPLEDPTEEQQAAFEAWTGWDFPAATGDEDDEEEGDESS